MADGSDVQVTVTIEPEDARKMANEIVSLREELADVRAQWQADVGSAIARAQTAEARVTALELERDAARAEAANWRELADDLGDTIGHALQYASGETERILRAALRGPAQSEKGE